MTIISAFKFAVLGFPLPVTDKVGSDIPQSPIYPPSGLRTALIRQSNFVVHINDFLPLTTASLTSFVRSIL